MGVLRPLRMLCGILQGYLAHKKQRPCRTLQENYAYDDPRGEPVFYERGNPGGWICYARHETTAQHSMYIYRWRVGHSHSVDLPIWEGRYKAAWKSGFKLPWREAGPPNHLDHEVGQKVVSNYPVGCR